MRSLFFMKTLISFILVSFVITVSGAISASAQSNGEKITQQIIKLESELAEATRKLDADAFERFYSPDFVVTARIPPEAVTRAERLARLRDPNFKRGIIESVTN